jgi:hypothetical protein
MALTVGELAQILNSLLRIVPRCADDIVVIPVYRPNAIGAMPCVGVRSAGQGFDWEAGKYILWPEKELVEKEGTE